MPLTEDTDHHFITMIVRYDTGSAAYGHLALGLRHRGGNAEEDFVMDPRAPERAPTGWRSR